MMLLMMLLVPICRVPEAIVVVPKKVLAPERMTIPVPCLTMPPDPWITPEYVVDAVAVPKVRNFGPNWTKPPPVKSPMVVPVAAMPLMLKLAVDPICKGVVAGKAPAPLRAKVPLAMTVSRV